MQQKVSTAGDLTIVAPAFIDISHVILGPCVELPANIGYLPPINSGDHKLAHDVQHRGQAIAQAFHNCGRYIVHLSGYGDPAIGTFQSSRTCMFSAMEVLAENEPIGFGLLFNMPPTPMLTCGNIPLPIGDATDSVANSVIVGMDPLWDYALSWVGVAVEMLVARAVFEVGLGLPPAATPATWGMNEVVRAASPGRFVVEVARGFRSGPDGAARAFGRNVDRVFEAVSNLLSPTTRAFPALQPPPPSQWDLI